MLGDQEELISEPYNKNGRHLDHGLILYAPKTDRYHPLYPLPKKHNPNILGKPN